MAHRLILARGGVVVRPLARSDETEWLALRSQNRAWLRPWESTTPPGRNESPISFAAHVRRENRLRRSKRAFPMVIVVKQKIVGRVSIGRIEWGAECGGSLGYWVREDMAGKGIVPAAAALLCEYGFEQGLHRVEIAVRPENTASARVAQKLGFRDEGVRRKYLYIDGDWRDHHIYALTLDEPRTGMYWASGS